MRRRERERERERESVVKACGVCVVRLGTRDVRQEQKKKW